MPIVKPSRDAYTPYREMIRWRRIAFWLIIANLALIIEVVWCWRREAK